MITIVILSVLAALLLPWFIGVPLGVVGLIYVAWPRFEKRSEVSQEPGETQSGSVI